ncbi:MAG: hypothetical protein IPM50_03055 [Acidobacteriota bacterium]|nr:MAG: hypothetical protein IPM50_03055 [Acidobacteriota bacterium]
MTTKAQTSVRQRLINLNVEIGVPFQNLETALYEGIRQGYRAGTGAIYKRGLRLPHRSPLSDSTSSGEE